MRLLLLQNSLYVPSHGGANKANRLICEALARRGHCCEALTTIADLRVDDYVRRLRELGATVLTEGRSGVAFEYNGVRVHSYQNSATLVQDLLRRIGRVRPDYLLVSSEDPFQVLLRAALAQSAIPVLYLAHTILLLPFGPGAMAQHAPGADAMRRCAGVVSFSRFSQEYMERWGAMQSTLLHLPWFGDPPYADFSSDSGEYVVMVNPCAVKGLSIFLQLAGMFPDIPFAAVPTWGTTGEDRERLGRLPNITALPAADDIELTLRKARVLLVPSLWQEAFGLIATEAMLRGIPVIASDLGGLPEAKLGVDYVLPVNPIREYTAKLDGQHVPRPEIPPQDLQPWAEALRRLLTDESHWKGIAASSRKAALDFAEECRIESFEKYLFGNKSVD
jgi:glycosyltransferase involved in cell wall biosynthesis